MYGGERKYFKTSTSHRQFGLNSKIFEIVVNQPKLDMGAAILE